jgi:hypothetical protein
MKKQITYIARSKIIGVTPALKSRLPACIITSIFPTVAVP